MLKRFFCILASSTVQLQPVKIGAGLQMSLPYVSNQALIRRSKVISDAYAEETSHGKDYPSPDRTPGQECQAQAKVIQAVRWWWPVR